VPEDSRVLRVRHLWCSTSDRLASKPGSSPPERTGLYNIYHGLTQLTQLATVPPFLVLCLVFLTKRAWQSRSKYLKRWYRGKLHQTIVDSWFCVDCFVPEGMSQVSSPSEVGNDKSRILNTRLSCGTSAGPLHVPRGLTEIAEAKQERKTKWAGVLTISKKGLETRSSRFEFKISLNSFSIGSGPPLITGLSGWWTPNWSRRTQETVPDHCWPTMADPLGKNSAQVCELACILGLTGPNNQVSLSTNERSAPYIVCTYYPLDWWNYRIRSDALGGLRLYLLRYCTAPAEVLAKTSSSDLIRPKLTGKIFRDNRSCSQARIHRSLNNSQPNSRCLLFNVIIYNPHPAWFPHDCRKAVLALLITSGFDSQKYPIPLHMFSSVKYVMIQLFSTRVVVSNMREIRYWSPI